MATGYRFDLDAILTVAAELRGQAGELTDAPAAPRRAGPPSPELDGVLRALIGQERELSSNLAARLDGLAERLERVVRDVRDADRFHLGDR